MNWRYPPPRRKPVARYNWNTGLWTDGGYSGRRRLRACERCSGPMFSCTATVCHDCRRKANSERSALQREKLREIGLLGTKERKPAPNYKIAQRRAIALVSVAKNAGKLPRLDGSIICVECKRQPARVYDHRDYSKPLEVEAVCDYCNSRRGPALWSVPAIAGQPRAAEAGK